MKCPICAETDLVMTERQGVEIDYCPKCRGVWLDRGELDKIIERSVPQGQTAQPSSMPSSPAPQGYGYAPQYDSHSPHQGHQGHHGQGYRRKSWLGELFD
jgi:uncharacterized protein